MNKWMLLFASLLLALPVLGQEPVKDWARTNRYAAANAAVSVRPKAVFMGDSITEQWCPFISYAKNSPAPRSFASASLPLIFSITTGSASSFAKH